MKTMHNFKGKISFKNKKHEKKIILPYETYPYESDLDRTMISSFGDIHLTKKEKQNLSRDLRIKLHGFKEINLFELTHYAHKLCQTINKLPGQHYSFSATEYGAFICLAALFSGELDSKKTIEFNLGNAPICFFPKLLIKTPPHKTHQFIFSEESKYWLSNFHSLTYNDLIYAKIQRKTA